MRKALRNLLLSAIESDIEARLEDGTWTTRCLHCRAKLLLREDGLALNGATLEHVVPQSWFEKRGAAELIADLNGPNDPRNLALACPRCNQGKGSRHDARGPGNARAQEVVLQLKQRRLARWKSAQDEAASH